MCIPSLCLRRGILCSDGSGGVLTECRQRLTGSTSPLCSSSTPRRDVDYNDQSPLDASTFVHQPVVSRAELERPLANPRTHRGPLSCSSFVQLMPVWSGGQTSAARQRSGTSGRRRGREDCKKIETGDVGDTEHPRYHTPEPGFELSLDFGAQGRRTVRIYIYIYIHQMTRFRHDITTGWFQRQPLRYRHSLRCGYRALKSVGCVVCCTVPARTQDMANLRNNR